MKNSLRMALCIAFTLALILGTSSSQSSAQSGISISAGWNLLDVPVQSSTLTGASSYLQSLNGSLGAGAAKLLAIYANGRFSVYVPGYSPDLSLQPSQGVFVESSVRGIWQLPIDGTNFTVGQTMTLQPGWNLVGAPFPAAGLGTDAIATEVGTGFQELATYTGGSYVVYTKTSTPSTVAPTQGMWILVSRPTPWSPFDLSSVQSSIDAMFTSGGFQGSALVLYNGSIIFQAGYGFANSSTNTPNAPSTEFELASVTKQFTAAAILQLQESGKLNATDAVCKYVPNCPSAWAPITIAELLDHTSGIPGNQDNPTGFDWLAPHTHAEILAYAESLALVHTPGTTYDYSNLNYAVLGSIIEQVTGETYTQYVQTHIFTPLGMTNTGVLQDGATVSNMAVPYNGSSVAPPWYDNNDLYSFGGIYSNVDDMALWINGLLNNTILSAQSVNAMFAPAVPIDPGQYYGYGFAMQPAYCGPQRIIWHDGELSGIMTEDVIFPDDGVNMVFLSNNQVTNTDSYIFPIAQILIPAKCG